MVYKWKRLKYCLSGFTLVEILIVVSILAILSAIIFMTDMTGSLRKARDSKRKQDLSKMTRLLDDYYNDHAAYPLMNDPADGQMAGYPWGGNFSQYSQLLPKDPGYPQRWYYYQSGPKGEFFVIYAKLENTGDPDITLVGCQEGCGPKNKALSRTYNYYVSSSDVRMLAGIPNGIDPGFDITIGGATPALGGGGTFTPAPTGASPTSPPAGPTATPTINLTPPPNQPGTCAYNTCCLNAWCGEIGGIGSYCFSNEKCIYQPLSGTWGCAFDDVQCTK